MLVKVTTIILFVVYIKSMLLMEDPVINSFARTLSKEERQKEQEFVNFAEKGFIAGVEASINGYP